MKKIRSLDNSYKKIHHCSLDLETSSLDEMDASIVGISRSVGSGLACYIPVGHGEH